MTVGIEHFFDGKSWNREAVVAAQRGRALSTAKELGWEPMERSFLSAPLSEAFVEEFERNHQIRLPDEYRLFLLQVGDGGDGPGLYLRPLGSPFDDSLPWVEGTVHRGPQEPNELLDRPFMYTDMVYMKPEDASVQTTAGALPLFDQGCAMWDLLVVTGEEEGKIWLDRLVDEECLKPAVDDHGQHIGFAQHYCRWLIGQ